MPILFLLRKEEPEWAGDGADPHADRPVLQGPDRGEASGTADQQPVRGDGDRLQQAVLPDGVGELAQVAEVGPVTGADPDGVDGASEFDVPAEMFR